jgi:hemerythrin-like domain-containing protein
MDSRVADMMVDDHLRIEKMVDDLAGRSAAAQQVLFAMQMRFALEEKATFSLKGSADPDDRALGVRLIKEHEHMLITARAVVEMEEQIDLLLGRLKQMLRSHIEFEDDNFYQAFDRSLSKTNREYIISKLKDAAES